WPAFPLHPDRAEVCKLEAVAGVGGRGARSDDLARLCCRHQPGGQIYGVAHDRVFAAVAGADFTGEDEAAVDTDAVLEIQLYLRLRLVESEREAEGVCAIVLV